MSDVVTILDKYYYEACLWNDDDSGKATPTYMCLYDVTSSGSPVYRAISCELYDQDIASTPYYNQWKGQFVNYNSLTGAPVTFDTIWLVGATSTWTPTSTDNVVDTFDASLVSVDTLALIKVDLDPHITVAVDQPYLVLIKLQYGS